MKFLLLLNYFFAPQAHAAVSSTIQLPDNFTPDLMAQVSALFGNFSPYIIAIVSVLLIAIVIDIVVGALRHKG